MENLKTLLDLLEDRGMKISRRELLRLTATTGLSLSAIAALAGVPLPRVQAASAAESGVKGGTVKIDMYTDIQKLDPHRTTAWNDYAICESLFCGLTALDDKMEPQPDLAMSWDIPDPTTYIFHLRRGVRFHNGREFKAADVKFSYERILGFERKCKWYTLINDIAQMDIIDDYTFKITLKQPNAPFISNLAYAPIVAQENIEKIETEPVGTGPFKFVERVPNSHVKMIKNEAFYIEGQPMVDEVLWIPTPEPSTLVANLQTGNADIGYRIEKQYIPQLRQTPSIKIYEPQGVTSYDWILIRHLPPLTNKKLRQAISYLIDRQAVNRVVYFGVGDPGANPFPPGHWAHSEIPEPSFDIEKAKKLLHEAGHPSGIDLSWTAMNFSDTVKIAEICQANFKKAGVNIKITQMEFATWIQKVYYNQDFQLAQTTMLREYDPDNLISSVIGKGGQNNPGGYENPRIEELLKKGRAELEREKRKAIYKEMAMIVVEDVPGIKIQTNPYVWISGKNIEGFAINGQSRPTIALRTMHFKS
jgi:peptide/nickel transport system substrate-binding protein